MPSSLAVQRSFSIEPIHRKDDQLPAHSALEFDLHLLLERQRDMETTRANVINSSELYAHDRVVERGLAFFEELLRDFHPRNFAIRLWDGSCLEAEPGQYARCTLVINHPGAMRRMFLPAN